MKRKLSVNIRFAEPKDLDFCVESDYDPVDKIVLKRKVEEEAVILAEVDRKLVGYLRLPIVSICLPERFVYFLKEP